VHAHRHPPLTPVSLLLPRRRLLVALLVVLLGLAVAAAVRNGQLLLTWDEPIQRSVEANRTPLLDQVFRKVSFLGSTVMVLTLGALGTAIAWRRCRAVALAVAVATITRPLVEFSFKTSVDRTRPEFEQLVAGTGPSFPSGHVMAAAALWGLAPAVVVLYTRRRAVWAISIAVAGALIVGISASRVYLGVHWFSDVAAGLIVSAFFLLAIEAVFKQAHRRHRCQLRGMRWHAVATGT
jgi:undecaprenyl-diphosphatase